VRFRLIETGRDEQYQLIATSKDAASSRHQLVLQLHRLLDYDPEMAEKDLQFMLRQAQSSDTKSQNAVYWVLQSPRFKQWIQSPGSDVLVVDGNLEDGSARYSAMSLLCGLTIQSLRSQAPACVLHFFCGAHNSKRGAASGPCGMIRSLTAQLLSLRPFDVGFMKSGYWKEGLETQSPSMIGRLFRRLLEQLPRMMVFCIIDGASLFDAEPWTGELWEVFQALLGVVADQQLGAQVKLLVASTTRSRCMGSMLDERNILSVPVDNGSARSLTDRAMKSELAKDESRPVASSTYFPSFENVYEQGYE